MATVNFRRFSHPETLKAISMENLYRFLVPAAEYFLDRGADLGLLLNGGDFDFDALASIFMDPFGMPQALVEALYIIHEMSTPEDMDRLLEEAERKDISIHGTPTPADIAIDLWLRDKTIVERGHAQQQLTHPRSFTYFQTNRKTVPNFIAPGEDTLVALQNDLDDYFEKKKRGRGSRVFCFPQEDKVWFLVKHGDPFARIGLHEGGEPSAYFRPEKFDVVMYDSKLSELGINADPKGVKEQYQLMFGRHLFSDDNFFPGTEKYTLEPLKTDGKASLVCIDVNGMEDVKLTELVFYWGGPYHNVEIKKADDLFADYESRDRRIHEKANIKKATFAIKFTDSKTPRKISIRPSNIAQFKRDSDAGIIDEWLTNRGFIIKKEQNESEAKAEDTTVLAGA